MEETVQQIITFWRLWKDQKANVEACYENGIDIAVNVEKLQQHIRSLDLRQT